jgi:hypothetical protein
MEDLELGILRGKIGSKFDGARTKEREAIEIGWQKV